MWPESEVVVVDGFDDNESLLWVIQLLTCRQTRPAILEIHLSRILFEGQKKDKGGE